jgi:hypothetical protein
MLIFLLRSKVCDVSVELIFCSRSVDDNVIFSDVSFGDK